MGSKKLLAWVISGFLAFSAAPVRAEDELQEILGNFPVLSWQNEAGVGGRITIQSNQDGVGIVSEPLSLASQPVPARKVLTPKDSTVLKKVGNVILQQGSIPDRRTAIRYEIFDGYLTINASICWPDGSCEVIDAVVTRGNAPGESVDVKAFMEAHSGAYDVLKAGGEVPSKPETLDLDTSGDPLEGAIYAPYCEPGSNQCDLGYTPFPYGTTRVFKTTVSPDRVVYDILVGSGTGLKYYTWEEREGRVLFRNYQYVLPTQKQTVCLEHEAQKQILD